MLGISPAPLLHFLHLKLKASCNSNGTLTQSSVRVTAVFFISRPVKRAKGPAL